MKNITKLRIFLWFSLACMTGWFLYMGIVPGGEISYIQDFGGDSYFIKKITPEERVEKINDGSQNIIGDPVYFSLRTPRRFNDATLILKYKNKSDWPIVEAGVLVDKKIWRYDLRPIGNSVVDNLTSQWSVLRDGDVVLLQKEKEYNTIDDFLSAEVDSNEVAVYNYDLSNNFIISEYKAQNREKEINYSLRGDWQVLTYIKDEDLNFKFDLVDLNKNNDKDDIDINLYYNNELIDSLHIDDEFSENGEMGEGGRKEFVVKSLPEGFYKIELKASDDILTKKIITKQSKFVFENKIWLADNSAENFSIFTDSPFLSVQTINPGSLQEIKAGDGEIYLGETFKQFGLQLKDKLTQVSLAKGDVILSGNGVFGFDQQSFFNPNFKKIDKDFNVNSNSVKYIIARYETPSEEDGWKIAKINFDISNAYREFYKYSFLISIPGLRIDDDINDSIEIDEIRVDLKGTSLVEKFKKYLDI